MSESFTFASTSALAGQAAERAAREVEVAEL